MLVKSIGLVLPFPNQHYASLFKDKFWPALLQPAVKHTASLDVLLPISHPSM